MDLACLLPLAVWIWRLWTRTSVVEVGSAVCVQPHLLCATTSDRMWFLWIVCTCLTDLYSSGWQSLLSTVIIIDNFTIHGGFCHIENRKVCKDCTSTTSHYHHPNLYIWKTVKTIDSCAACCKYKSLMIYLAVPSVFPSEVKSIMEPALVWQTQLSDLPFTGGHLVPVGPLTWASHCGHCRHSSPAISRTTRLCTCSMAIYTSYLPVSKRCIQCYHSLTIYWTNTHMIMIILWSHDA